MKFPPNTCIPTSLLTRETYSLLICKLVTDGYVNLIPHLSYDLMMMWDYLGTDIYDCVNVYSHPHSFMEPNAWMNYRDVKDENYPNIMTKEQLEIYLGGGAWLC